MFNFFNFNSTPHSTPNPHSHPTPIFWDVDDTILQSTEAIVPLINTLYLIPNNLTPKSPSDVKDWTFRSIYRSLTPDTIESLFSSDAFWSTVEMNPYFKTLMSSSVISNPKNYTHIFITKGTPENLRRKEHFLVTYLTTHFPHLHYDFLGLTPSQQKSSIDMSNGIMVDDNITYLLPTNASIKILIKNFRETDYNNSFGEYTDQIDLDDNLYIVNELKEVQEILEFNTKCCLFNAKHCLS